MIQCIVRILISLRAILIFPKNFLNFRLNKIGKQDIINLSNNSSKSYAFVVLIDSKVTFIGKEEDAAFCLFLFCVFFIHNIA